MSEFNDIGGYQNPTRHLRYVLIDMMRQYFAQQTSIEGVRWVEDEKKTGIYIVEKFPTDIAAEDPRPAIVIERGPFRRQPMAVGDDLLQAALPKDVQAHTSIMAGSIAIHCISRYGLQAEAIAWAVHDLVVLYSEELASRVPLHHIGATTVDQERPFRPGEQPDKQDWADVPVTVEAFINRTLIWNRSPDRPLDLALNSN